MRPLWKDILIALWLGMLVPGIVLNGFVLLERQNLADAVQIVPKQETSDSEPGIRVRDPDGICVMMDPDTYLTGVLLAEMPSSFHPEALKAQAAAARTYARKAEITGGKHKDGSVCTDSVCCQAYLSEESYLARGGTEESIEKVRQAVQATSAMVLVYEGQLIEATYFSSSAGSTEAALEVWGVDYPYLQAVSSPENRRVETCVFSLDSFQNLLGVSLAGAPAEWFGSVTYTAGGGVDTMEIGGELFSGVQLRSILKLPSTVFSVSADHQKITITTMGYGHRVGMSQYGANALAESGSTWQQILQHYYPDTALVPWG